MNKDTYILQVNLPDGAVIGDEYEKGSSDMYWNKRLSADSCPVIEHNSYFTWQVENNSTFFKKKEEEQPKEPDTFVWTDELVKEIVGNAHRSGFNKEPCSIIDRIVQFKQSKSTPTKIEVIYFGIDRRAYLGEDTGHYQCNLSHPIPSEKYDQISKAIEQTLNQ